MASEYDFIIVGAGPSGCALASRLANSAKKPSVLLIEAGGDNKSPEYLIPSDRFTLAFKEPSLNWGYKTVPQSQLTGQEIDYSRGKGLGGSSAINFGCWVIGADEDFNEWARILEDDAWSWTNVKERFKKIENYHVELPDECRNYVNPKAADHGTSGPIELSFPLPWERGLVDVFKAAEEVGLGVNTDINSGNPIGMGMCAANLYKGSRTTAAAYLRNTTANLTILANATVAKVLISGKKAVGIKTLDGREVYAKRDVILSCGALDTPKLLMLSGVGPVQELEKHGIQVIHDLPELGKNLQDHCFSTATLLQKSGTNDRMAYETNPQAAAAAAKEQNLYGSIPMGWFKSDAVLESSEFKDLDNHTQNHINKPTIPAYEIATHTPPLFTGGYELQQTDSYLTALAFVMNPQSIGEVTLSSADPLAAPKFDPKFLSHPFDRRVIIEAMRSLMDLLEAPAFKDSTVKMIGCPKSRSDEDIWEHCSGNLFSSWHMCRTAKMGKAGDKSACVDTNFKVNGIENLRVVDLSVIPLLPNNHTQSTAYLVGETAAEKLIAEYGLN